MSQFGFDMSMTGSGFIKGTFENAMASSGFWVPRLSACMVIGCPVCYPFDGLFHGKSKGSTVFHHGHVRLRDVHSGVTIFYVQCHTAKKICCTVIEWL